MKADTSVDPDAVVIILFDAGIAEAAVLRSSWFRNVTGGAPGILRENDSITSISLNGAFQLFLISVFPVVARIRKTGLIITVVAERHTRHRYVLMDLTDVGVG